MQPSKYSVIVEHQHTVSNCGVKFYFNDMQSIHKFLSVNVGFQYMESTCWVCMKLITD